MFIIVNILLVLRLILSNIGHLFQGHIAYETQDPLVIDYCK